MKYLVWSPTLGEDEHDALTVEAERAVDAVSQVALLDLCAGIRSRADWCVRVSEDLVVHVSTDENARVRTIAEGRSA